jgi:hypothetical protein
MKKSLLSLSLLLVVAATTTQAQENRKSLKKKDKVEAAASPADVIKFKEETFDFGTIVEGDKAEHVFEFVNAGKAPITIQSVNSSCGCTTPAWSKEPVAPKKKGQVTVNYRTSVGPINRQVTVNTDAGTKVLKITGTVVPKPATSVPESKSAIKAN